MGLPASRLATLRTFPQHVFHFVDLNAPRRVAIVQVKGKHAQGRVCARAKVPEREHELSEVDRPTAILVEYRERLQVSKQEMPCRHTEGGTTIVRR